MRLLQNHQNHRFCSENLFSVVIFVFFNLPVNPGHQHTSERDVNEEGVVLNLTTRWRRYGKTLHFKQTNE